MVNNHDEMAANLAKHLMMFQRNVNGHEKYPNGNIQFAYPLVIFLLIPN